MGDSTKRNDNAQDRLTDYAQTFTYEKISDEAVHAAKVRLIDTLGVLIGGFPGEPCRIARNLARQMRQADGATVIGTRWKSSPDIAAFANGTAVRFLDMNDNYNFPNSHHGHPSDSLASVLAGAEIARADGRAVLSAVVLAYEMFLQTSDIFRNRAFDTANQTVLASAVATGKLLGLERPALAHAISMAVVPNGILKQVRGGQRSMYKAVASGHAARAGVFAALLAKEGMIGPNLPFEGEAGWSAHVAHGSFDDRPFGGEGDTPFKILDSRMKLRPANAGSIATILAAERVAPLGDLEAVERVLIEVSAYTKRAVGSGSVPWNPDTREIADHSAPYLVASALIDGTVGVNSFDEHLLRDATRRALIKKIEVAEDPEFTMLYERVPVQEHARVTVFLKSGEKLVGKSGGGSDDLSAPKSDEEIVAKFYALTVPHLGKSRASGTLDMVWQLESLNSIEDIIVNLAIEGE